MEKRLEMAFHHVCPIDLGGTAITFRGRGETKEKSRFSSRAAGAFAVTYKLNRQSPLDEIRAIVEGMISGG